MNQIIEKRNSIVNTNVFLRNYETDMINRKQSNYNY